jgi:hypothetical protein
LRTGNRNGHVTEQVGPHLPPQRGGGREGEGEGETDDDDWAAVRRRLSPAAALNASGDESQRVAQSGRLLLPEAEPEQAAMDIDALTAMLVAMGFSSERGREAAVGTAGRGFADIDAMLDWLSSNPPPTSQDDTRSGGAGRPETGEENEGGSDGRQHDGQQIPRAPVSTSDITVATGERAAGAAAAGSLLPAPPTVPEDSVVMLTVMGFERSAAVAALRATGSDVEQACELLCGMNELGD